MIDAIDPTSLLPSLEAEGIAVASRAAMIDPDAATPYPEELALVTSAGGARRAEVLTGRALARAVLAELGGPEGPIGRRADRSPDWPDGFGGSISHAGGWCLVVVARLSEGWGVGLDIEADRPLAAEVAARVLRPAERSRLAAGAPPRGETIAFSAKESVFKAVNPLTGRWLEHHDVGLDLATDAEADRGTFEVSWPGRGGRALGDLSLAGRWLRAGHFVATGCVARRV